ncbi:uncharacterized protein LOC144726833 [Lampetra planeri]
METRKTRRTHGIDREEDLDDSEPLVAGGEEEDLPTLQGPSTAPAERPGTDTGLREAHSRLAELLLAAASILAEISSSGGAGTVGDILQGRPADSRQNEWGIPAIAPGPTFGGDGERHVVVGSQARASTSSAREGVRHLTSAAGAAILDTDGQAERNHEADDFIFQQRLPTLSAFKAEGGDWGQFQRRFLAHQEMSAWSDATALRALPAMLDDDALAAFRAARKSDRSTLKDALGLLARVYGPPSTCRHQFYARRKAATETALAYRTALLALADAAFPRMDEEGQDAMVLEQLLKLAQDLGVPINTADDIDISSLRVATSIQAHEALQRKQGVGCNAAVVAAPGLVVAEPQVVSPREEAFATGRPGDWRPGARSPLRSGRKSEQPRSTPTLVTCYNCGLRGHVASGCRAPRQRAIGARLDDDREPKSSLQSPASRGTSHARPVYSAHMGRRVAAEEGRLRFGDSVRRGGFGRDQGDIEWAELGHRIVAASAGSSVVTGSIDGVEIRVLVDTGASATIISDLIYNILPVQCRPLLPVDVPFYAANGGSLGIIGQVRASICIGDIKLSGPVFVSSSLAVPCLLGTDFLAKMPIKILIDQRCIELPSGRRISFLTGPTDIRTACATIQAVATQTVQVPPGSQMLIPLRLRKPWVREASGQSMLLGPSNKAVGGLDLSVAHTLVRADRDPFVMVLNAGSRPAVIPQGTVLAHAAQVPGDDGLVAQVGSSPARNVEPREDLEWVHSLCAASDDLSAAQLGALRELLIEFSDVFSKHKYDIGCTDLLHHHIETGDAAPVRLNPFRLSPVEKEHVQSAVNDMLEADIISPSSSPWGAPIVLVKKQDGSLRFCVDFRRLNKISVADAYPLPRMDESLDALSGARYFSTLDLLSGFWQLPLDEESKPKTAFRTPGGLFQFNRLPMGLHSSPATFQRLMELVLSGLQWDTCLIYMDDVIVFSKTFEEHLRRLRGVFLRMRSAKLKFKPAKCHLLRRSVRYLGHIVDSSGISTDPAKTDCVGSWPTPTSVSDVRSFIGFASYYRRFVEHFATIAKPLHALTAKGVKFKWGPEEEAAFRSLRDALVGAPPLCYPDFASPFLLDTDASNTGIGGVLSQVVGGVERVVAYGSRVLSPAEQRYCVTRRELLAIVFFVQQFRPYLYGRHFIVRTDHAALQYSLRVAQPSGSQGLTPMEPPVVPPTG